jgi:uncharacterized protein YdbL (DUF1318 family)
MCVRSRSFDGAGGVGSAHPTRRRFASLLGAGLLLLGTALAAPASAQSARLLDAPRAAGTVGERYDGLAVVRADASPEIVALVDKVNAERRSVYAERAAKDHAPVEAVGKIYAVEILKSAPPGTWFVTDTGKWLQKK